MTTRAWIQKHVDFAMTLSNEDCIGILESIAVRLAISPLEKEASEDKPCSHPGCRSHVTHPCEGCGRQWGKL